MRKTPYIPGAEPEDDRPTGPSKSQRKRDMHALQDLGEALVDLSAERLSRVPLTEDLREAILETQRTKSHEGRRRQLQLVGKLMRAVEAEPIRAALDALTGQSREETARFHRLERLRDAFLDDETTLTDIMNRYPQADSQHLRNLRRNALKERDAMKPPKSYRELFRALRDLDETGAA